MSSVTSMGEARRQRGGRAGSSASAGPQIAAFVPSWQLALEAATKSPRTVRSYLDSVRALHTFLVARGIPADVEGVDAGARMTKSRSQMHIGETARAL
jgi:hypothetical protein